MYSKGVLAVAFLNLLKKLLPFRWTLWAIAPLAVLIILAISFMYNRKVYSDK